MRCFLLPTLSLSLLIILFWTLLISTPFVLKISVTFRLDESFMNQHTKDKSSLMDDSLDHWAMLDQGDTIHPYPAHAISCIPQTQTLYHPPKAKSHVRYWCAVSKSTQVLLVESRGWSTAFDKSLSLVCIGSFFVIKAGIFCINSFNHSLLKDV